MIYLYGAGGHAKVIAEILESQNEKIAAIIDDDVNLKSFWNYPVLHAIPESFDLMNDKFIIAIGSNESREKVASRTKVIYATAIHSSATISSRVRIGEGTVVMGNVLINADSGIGRHCIINSQASIDHDCVVGDYVHIAPGSVLCGNVSIGKGSFIGAGSVLIPNITIGKNSIVGAGSVVLRDVPDNVVVAGNPAKVIRHMPVGSANYPLVAK